MKKELLSFFKKFSVFVLCIGLLLFLWQENFPGKYASGAAFPLLTFFVATTIAFHFILISAANKGPQNFVRYFMGATALKLLIYFMVIIIYLFAKKSNPAAFILTFLFLYLSFSVFEVVALLKHFKKPQ